METPLKSGRENRSIGTQIVLWVWAALFFGLSALYGYEVYQGREIETNIFFVILFAVPCLLLLRAAMGPDAFRDLLDAVGVTDLVKISKPVLKYLLILILIVGAISLVIALGPLWIIAIVLIGILFVLLKGTGLL
jgi:hypothetical protein